MRTDWLPAKREEQLVMAKRWLEVITPKLNDWGLSSDIPISLKGLVDAAEEALAKVESAQKTAEDVTRCQVAFDHLKTKMRDIKHRYFNIPPLDEGNFTALGLRLRDTIKTPVAAPTGQVEADVSYPGPRLLQLHIKPVAGTQIDPRADHGYRIYYGVLPSGGANVKEATGKERYLTQEPISGDELPHSKFTRKQKETFEFPAADSGRVAYFSICFENSKGESGPWGTVFSAVVP